MSLSQYEKVVVNNSPKRDSGGECSYSKKEGERGVRRGEKLLARLEMLEEMAARQAAQLAAEERKRQEAEKDKNRTGEGD